MANYEIIIYSTACGLDELGNYSRVKDARRRAKQELRRPDITGAIVYDLRKCQVVSLYGYFPERAMPLQRPTLYRVYSGLPGRGYRWTPCTIAYASEEDAQAAKTRAERCHYCHDNGQPLQYIIRVELGALC